MHPLGGPLPRAFSTYNHIMQRIQTGITASTLKVAAIIGMTANHVAHALSGQLPVFATEALFWLGGITFPIMAYLIVEGYRHTSDVRRYLGRLLAFGVISQAPYTLLFGWTGNVFFTLAIGLAIIWAHDACASRKTFAAILIGGLAVSLLCDWGLLGPLMILLFYLLREHPHGLFRTMVVPYAATLIPALIELGATISGLEGPDAGSVLGFTMSFERFADATKMLGLPIEAANTLVAEVANMGYALIGFTLACILLLLYDGRRGRPMKWLFYIYYPAHLLVIWLVKLALS